MFLNTTKWWYRRRQWHPTPVLLPGKSHGWRSLVGCSPWGHWESDTTERLHFLFSLSCIGEGNGNPLQCSCLENPRDGGAWWAAIYGVAQSRAWLKQLSSSSISVKIFQQFHIVHEEVNLLFVHYNSVYAGLSANVSCLSCPFYTSSVMSDFSLVPFPSLDSPN